jgi:molybdopterin/thiamine biosynthesis adenylyltransferase
MTDRTFLHEAEYRGQAAMEKLAHAKVTICGVGAIGSNLAESLARQGFENLTIIDADKVEQHNIGNQAYTLGDVGGWKTEIMRNRLFEVCEVEVAAVNKRLDERNAKKLLQGADLIVDAFDNSASRQAIQDACRASELVCVHVGLFEDYCEVIWDEQYRVPADVDGDVCEYPLARNLVTLAVALAGELITRFAIEGDRHSVSATLGDFAVQTVSPEKTA